MTQGYSFWLGRGQLVLFLLAQTHLRSAMLQICLVLAMGLPGASLLTPQLLLQGHLAAPHGRDDGHHLHPPLRAYKNSCSIPSASTSSPGRCMALYPALTQHATLLVQDFCGPLGGYQDAQRLGWLDLANTGHQVKLKFQINNGFSFQYYLVCNI